MNYLPASKHGDCTKCPAKDTACVKVGKELICIKCNNAGKTKKQIFKAKQRNLNNLSNKVKSFAKGEDAIADKDLEVWFDNVKRQIIKNPFCWECGMYIPEKYCRHASAHIFPKAIFESVATHPLNYLVLGASCGCHDKTHRLDTFSDMGVFGEAVRRFRIFEPSITEKHKYLDTFRSYADGTI